MDDRWDILKGLIKEKNDVFEPVTWIAVIELMNKIDIAYIKNMEGMK